jgi:hypothetical protein
LEKSAKKCLLCIASYGLYGNQKIVHGGLKYEKLLDKSETNAILWILWHAGNYCRSYDCEKGITILKKTARVIDS